MADKNEPAPTAEPTVSDAERQKAAAGLDELVESQVKLIPKIEAVAAASVEKKEDNAQQHAAALAIERDLKKQATEFAADLNKKEPAHAKAVQDNNPSVKSERAKQAFSESDNIRKKTDPNNGVPETTKISPPKPEFLAQIIEPIDSRGANEARIISSSTVATTETLPNIQQEIYAEPSEEPVTIFEAYDSEFGEVQVPNELIDEINDIDISETLETMPINDEADTAPAAEPIGDVLSEEGILELLDEATVEIEPLPEIVTDYIDFISLLRPEEPIDTGDAETRTALANTEITPLPPICIEVTKIIAELQITQPEAAQAAVETLEEISFVIDEVIKLRQTGNVLAPDKEQELMELCIKFFTEIKKQDFTQADIMDFIQGLMQAKHVIQTVDQINNVQLEEGTHEIKQEHDPVFGLMFQKPEEDLTHAIGIHAVKNYQFALAG